LVTTAAVIAIQIGYLIGMVVRVGTDSGVTAARKSVEQRQHGFQNLVIARFNRHSDRVQLNKFASQKPEPKLSVDGPIRRRKPMLDLVNYLADLQLP